MVTALAVAVPNPVIPTNCLLRKQLCASRWSRAVGKDPLTPVLTLSEHFDPFLRERVYLHNITPKTKVFYETAVR